MSADSAGALINQPITRSLPAGEVIVLARSVRRQATVRGGLRLGSAPHSAEQWSPALVAPVADGQAATVTIAAATIYGGATAPQDSAHGRSSSSSSSSSSHQTPAPLTAPGIAPMGGAGMGSAAGSSGSGAGGSAADLVFGPVLQMTTKGRRLLPEGTVLPSPPLLLLSTRPD